MNTECSICYENLNNNKFIITTECNHTFHIDCILGWNVPTCPLCRRDTDFKNLILYQYKSEINQYINWYRASRVFNTLSNILIFISSLLIFAATSFGNKRLEYISSGITLLAFISKTCADFIIKEIKNNNGNLNNTFQIMNFLEI